MRFFLKRKTGVVIFCIFFLLTYVSLAGGAGLTDIIVTNTQDDILLYFNVEGAFREKMKKAVLSGVPVTFSFFINLCRVRNFWMDEKIADIKLTHTIKYNNLKKEFVVKRSEEKNTCFTTQSFKEAQELMSEIASLKIVPLSRLEKDCRYQIRAKAELSKLTLPFYLHYVLVFLSFWDFETDWYTYDFTF